jgi:hypothetical protein
MLVQGRNIEGICMCTVQYCKLEEITKNLPEKYVLYLAVFQVRERSSWGMWCSSLGMWLSSLRSWRISWGMWRRSLGLWQNSLGVWLSSLGGVA